MKKTVENKHDKYRIYACYNTKSNNSFDFVATKKTV